MCDLNHIMKNILQTLSTDELNLFIKKDIKKGEMLYYEGEKCHEIGIVNSGNLIIASYSSNGQEIIYNSINSGGMFGNNLIFSTNPFYKGDVLATKDSLIYIINKDKLMTLLMNNKNFLEAYLSYQSDISIKLNITIKLLSFNSIEDRFFYFLSIHNNVYTYKSISTLAKTLHVSREALSRLITKLKKDNNIIVIDKTIKLFS